MTIVNVKGATWDVAEVNGNTVVLANGEEIEVSDTTLAEINSQLKPKRRKLI